MPGRLLAIWLESKALMRRNHTKQTLNAFSLFEHHHSTTNTAAQAPQHHRTTEKPQKTRRLARRRGARSYNIYLY